MTLQPSLERIYPDDMSPEDVVERESVELHLARYRFAAAHAGGERLLDIASGAGYGTALLAQAHDGIACFGLDCDADAVAYAREHYHAPNLQYLNGDAMAYEPEEGYDTIVSLETIEHLPDPAGFVARLAKMVAEGGRIIASVPITPSKDGNPHHLHDFSEKSFLALFGRCGLVPNGEKFYQDQVYFRFASLFKKAPKKRTQAVPNNLMKHYLRHPGAVGVRLWALCRHGFKNRYLTAIFNKL
jgi:SAM-dependent methyltransferase